MADYLALNLLLDANYVGRSAFGSMIADIEGVVSATNRLSAVGSAFKAVGDVMIATGLAAAAGLTYAVKAASDYETAINRIVAVTPDLQKNAQLLGQLNSQIGTTGSQYGINPADLAKGSYFLFSSLGALGANSNQLLSANIINELAQYSRASGWPNEGGISFGDAAQVLPRLFAASGAPLGQWGGDMGMLTFLENRAHMTQEQMASAMNAFLPAMSSLGIQFPDAATLMAGVATAGRIGAPGGRETLSALTLLLSGSKQQDALKGIGLSSSEFFDKSGKTLPIDQILNMLRTGIYGHAKSPADVLATEHNLFGQVGLRALGPLLAPEGWAKYQNLLHEEKGMGIYGNNQASALYMRTVSDSMMQSPGAQWDRFKASMELLGITIGDKVLPKLMQLGDAVDKIALKIVGFVNAHPKLSGALALGAVPGLLGGGLGMKGIGGLLQLIGGHDAGVVARNAGKMEEFLGLGGGRGGAGMLNALQDEGWGALELKKMPGKMGAAGWYKSNLSPAEFAMREANYKEAHDTLTQQLLTPPKLEKTLGEKLLAPFKSMTGASFTFGKNLPSTLASGVKGIPGAAGDVVAGAKALPGALAKLPSKGLDVIKGLWEAFKNLGPVIKGIIPTLLGFGTAALPIIAIVLLVAGAIAIGVLAFTKFRTQTMAALGPLFAEVHRVFDSIKKMILGAVQSIQDKWKQMWPQIKPAMEQFLAAVKQMGPVWTVLGTIIKLVVGIILTVIVGLVSGFLKALPAIIGVFTGIVEFITGVTAVIVDIFTGKWGKIPGDIGKIFQGIWHIIINLLGAVLSFIGGFVMGVLNFFNKMTGGALQGVIDWIHSLVGWFMTLPQRIGAYVAALVYTVSQKFEEMRQAGMNLIVGLIKGVEDKALDLANSVKKAVSGAIDGAKHILGIASPSSVFHEFGRMTVLGYTQGIQRHARDIDAVHGLFGLGRVGTLQVDNLHVPGQQRDNLGMFKLGNYVDAQRQRRMSRYSPDLDSLAYQERIGSQYTA